MRLNDFTTASPCKYSSTPSTRRICAARRTGECLCDMASMREFTHSMHAMPASRTAPTRQSTKANPTESTAACMMPVRMRTTMAPAMLSMSSIVEVQMAVRLPRLRSLKNPMGTCFRRSPMEMRLSSSMR